MKTAITGVEIPGDNLLCLTIGGHDVMHLRTAYSDEITKPLTADQVDAIFVAVMAGLGFGADGKPFPYASPIAALRTARDLIAEAMEVHIYGGDETPEPECNYTAGLREIDAALALAGSAPGTPRAQVAPDVNATLLATLKGAQAQGRTLADIIAGMEAGAAAAAREPMIPGGGMGERETLDAIRDLVVAGEEAGWDIGDNRDVLNKGREAYASLCVIMADAGDEPEEPSQDEPGEEDAGEAEADAYEQAARAAGWQQEDGNIFHADRGEANGTGDPLEYADTWRDACDISKVGPDHPRMPLTSDIGFLIRDMIEGQSFELLDTGGDDVVKVGHDHVDSVDCSDINNLRVYTRSGAPFVVRIIREA